MTRFQPAVLRLCRPSPGSVLALVCAMFVCGCGDINDDPAFVSSMQLTSRPVGARQGHFLARLNQSPADLPAFAATLSEKSGLLVKVESRFPGIDRLFADKARNLNQLVKLHVQGITEESANQSAFATLQALTGDDGYPLFATLDTDKHVFRDQAGNSSDALGGRQYYLDMIGWQDTMALLAPEAVSNAAPVVVGVFDTGIDGRHEDLTEAMWSDPADPASNGFNAFSGETGAARDQNGHGTSVAGVIGARSDNGKGIRGAASLRDGEGSVVRQPAELMSVTVLRPEDSAGSSDVIGRALLWAMSRHAEQQKQPGREQQKLIINLSLAGAFDARRYPYLLREDGSPVLRDDAVDFAAENDVLIIAAAGNESCRIGGPCGVSGQDFEETYYHPCSYENVLCVAASTHEDRLAGFSNRGASIDLVAPGWGIFSTAKSGGPRYSYFSGTSVATPLVTSAAAIVWSLFPELSASEVITVLRKSAARIPEIQQQIASGDGRLDLHAAVMYADALIQAGLGTSDMEPPVVTAEARRHRAPPIEGDPEAPSRDAFGADNGSKNSGGKGCGSIASQVRGGPFGALLLMLLIILPLLSSRSRG